MKKRVTQKQGYKDLLTKKYVMKKCKMNLNEHHVIKSNGTSNESNYHSILFTLKLCYNQVRMQATDFSG